MNQTIKTITAFLCLFSLSHPLSAGPWFTGPLLAPAGHTIPIGHTNLEVYGIDIFSKGHYNETGEVIHTPLFKTFVANPIITHGFTDWLDVQLTLPYAFNSTQGVRSNHLGDVATALGFQLVEQNGSPKRMDVRILVQETFPTGRYENLHPAALGTDSTGLGSYQTQVGLNLQYLLQVFNEHYLRTRVIISYLYANPVRVHGLTSYGGTINTQGTINPGNETAADLAFEYTLTQHWVAVMEGTTASGQATRFNGVINIGPIGSPTASIGSGQYHQTALAPAMEYNFNGNIGLIGGVWFPLSGRNTSKFMTYVLALNAYW